MSNGEDSVRVSYGVKELLNRIDARLASIDNKLDAKVDVAEFKILADRVDATVRRLDAVDQRFAVDAARDKDKTTLFSKREKAITLGIAIFAVVIQFEGHIQQILGAH